jgi:hypothetical protein
LASDDSFGLDSGCDVWEEPEGVDLGSVLGIPTFDPLRKMLWKLVG